LLPVVCSHAHRAEKEAASGCKVHGVRKPHRSCQAASSRSESR
jgi:hypothetical protein